MQFQYIAGFLGIFLLSYIEAAVLKTDEVEAKNLIEKIESEAAALHNEVANANWAYDSNITDTNLEAKLKASEKAAKRTKELWGEIKQYDWKSFKNEDVKRKFKLYSNIGSAALESEKVVKLAKIVSEMKETYSTASICDFRNKDKCTLNLEPDMTDILATSRNAEELKHVWVEFRKKIGPKVFELFPTYVDLLNESAKINGFNNTAESWVSTYETDNFRDQIRNLWEQVKPLYQQLHAYVRERLRNEYGPNVVREKGPIPAHILGNMWAQSWSNIYNFTLPYPKKEPVDVTAEMVKQNYDAKKIFKLSEEFFTSIGLSPMPESFWEKSILEKPTDRNIVCHASAWDFYDAKDFRVKQCTVPTSSSLITAHHEMGHIEYYLQYKDQPISYRAGANPGFHEAVGDVIALSVGTPKHLRKIGLLKSTEDDEEANINSQYLTGLSKIAFFPFGYLMDLWRWGVFEGKTQPSHYNCEWWKLRQEYQGVEPPEPRTEADFDPASKYHIIAGVPYIRYFVSYIIQFQFHKSLCLKAGEYVPNDPQKPLHKCDIYNSKEAGKVLKDMLSMGLSKPWPEAMEAITGQKEMDASAFLEYFTPLRKWLEEENAKKKNFIGWETSDMCHSK